MYIDAFFEVDSTLNIVYIKIAVLRLQQEKDSVSMDVLRKDIKIGKERETNQKSQIDGCDEQRENDKIIINALKKNNKKLWIYGGIIISGLLGTHFVN
jgi:hypothetical protein